MSNSPETSLTRSIIDVVTSPQVTALQTKRILNTLGRAVRATASAVLPLSAELFLTPPRKLENGRAIVLFNEAVAADGAWFIVAERKEGDDYSFFIFGLNEDDLSKSPFVKPDEVESDEILRQLKALNFTGQRIFTLLSLNQEIQNYQYFQTEEEKSKAQEANPQDPAQSATPTAPAPVASRAVRRRSSSKN